MSLWTRVRNVFRGDALNREIAEEMESHLAEAVAAGRDPHEARRAFGSMAREREASHQARVVGWMDSLRADVSFGWGQLMKRKVATAAAVLSLALAIGACTSAFRLVDALFLRPLPVSHPERLYAIQYRGIDETGKPSTRDISFYPEFVQMREAARQDAELVAISTPFNDEVTFDSETEKVHQQYVSGSMFSTFGLQPASGRLFTGDDDRIPKAAPVAVLSYGYWTARFGQDPKVVGRTFRMNNTVYQVVGMAPKGFRGTGPGVETDIFVPTMMNELVSEPDANWFQILAVVKPGVAIEPLVSKLGAADHLSRVETARRTLKLFPNAPKAFVEAFLSPKVELRRTNSGISSLQKDYGAPLLVLSVLVGMVLLIACVNVANLMSAQAASRAREMAVRVSLGAGRGRLVRLVMAESAMVGVAAAALGAMFAWWATPFVVSRIHPANTPLPLPIGPDWMVMIFGMALTVLVTVLSGLIPSLRASEVQPASALKGGEAPPTGIRWMQGMIAAQVAFCFVVLFAAGLFVSTLVRLTRQSMGFSSQRLLAVNAESSEPQPPVKWEQMAKQLGQVPGVESASLESWPLLSGGLMTRFISVNSVTWKSQPLYVLRVSPGWLGTMRIPLLSGRDLRAEDREPGSAIVNTTFAKMFFGGVNPVGRSFEAPASARPGSKPFVFKIVGLVPNVIYADLREPDLPVAYTPFQTVDPTGAPAPVRYASIEVRTKGDPIAMEQPLRRAVAQIDPEFSVNEVTTQEELAQDQLLRERLLAFLAGFFAGVALLLAGIGLYGVLHYSVVQREKEIGIRIALGAAVGNIARLVTGRVFLMVLLGAGAGLGLGMASVRFISTLLYGVKATDASMMTAPSAVLLAAACLAALPAVLRAVRIDPVVMLRAQ